MYNWSLVIENYPIVFERQKTKQRDYRPKIGLNEIDVLAINRRSDNVNMSKVLAPHTDDEVLEVNVKDWLTSSLTPKEVSNIINNFKICEPKIRENFPKSRIRRLFVSYDISKPGLEKLLNEQPQIDALCTLEKRGFRIFETQNYRGRVGDVKEDLLEPVIKTIKGFFDNEVYPSWGSLGMDLLRIYEYFELVRVSHSRQIQRSFR